MLEMSPRKGPATRERILELAESAVLEKGFAATSIEELIVAAGITKSGFFYHFKDKGELAALADMANTLVDGGIILSRIMRDKAILPQQIMLYRDFVRMVFLGA
jgi:AcrR family transcriptional regulator